MGDAPVQRRDPFDLPDVSGLRIGILGGTGEQGRGLGLRWAAAGLAVTLGSREPQRAAATAEELRSLVASQSGSPAAIEGAPNADAAECDVVVVAVPWAAHEATLVSLRADLAGRIVVDCVNPLGFDAQGAFPLPVPEGSAAQQAQALLPDARVVAAFHHISAVLLADLTQSRIDADVLVAGDDREATDTVQALAGRIAGMRGIYAGRLRNSGQLEALTANLISTNRRYRSHAGVRVTDL